jgi:hypothetical protein
MTSKQLLASTSFPRDNKCKKFLNCLNSHDSNQLIVLEREVFDRQDIGTTTAGRNKASDHSRKSIDERKIRCSYLKAGLETGAKAEADATQAARQNAVFIVLLLVGVFG